MTKHILRTFLFLYLIFQSLSCLFALGAGLLAFNMPVLEKIPQGSHFHWPLAPFAFGFVASTVLVLYLNKTFAQSVCLRWATVLSALANSVTACTALVFFLWIGTLELHTIVPASVILVMNLIILCLVFVSRFHAALFPDS